MLFFRIINKQTTNDILLKIIHDNEKVMRRIYPPYPSQRLAARGALENVRTAIGHEIRGKSTANR